MSLPMGFTAAGIACGLKPSGKPDLGLLVSDRPAVAAGVFTTNRVQAAPIQLTKRQIRRGSARAIVVNAGNANVCTGPRGLDDARAMMDVTAEALDVAAKDVLVASTGIIGVPLPVEVACGGIPAAAAALAPGGLDDLARSIMTTDTVPKTARAELDDGASIVAVAKGAGMIAPEMATMLCFVATDAPVTRAVVRDALDRATRSSFNMITIDGCMSTNDCVLVLANGAAGGDPIERDDPRAARFADALSAICASLARQMVEDGEGATKVLAIEVRGASNGKEARTAAMRVADSVLLRCAVHGADPNWGRVLAALGTAPIPFDPNVVDVWVAGEKLCERGGIGPGDKAAAAIAMKEREVAIGIDLHRGEASATVLTNDLSAEYVRINSEYTT